MEEYFYQHRKLCDEIHSYHKSLVNSYEALTSLIEGMKKTVLEFNQGVYSDEIRGLSSALGRMADMNREIGRLHAFESKILEATSIPVIKYEKENMHTLYDILFARNDLTKQYLKRRDN